MLSPAVKQLKFNAFLCTMLITLVASPLTWAEEAQKKSIKESLLSRINIASDDEIIRFIQKNKEAIQSLQKQEATEILEHSISLRKEDNIFANLIELLPQYINVENRFGITPVEIAASQAKMDTLTWIEKKYSTEYLFSNLKGVKIPLALLYGGHEKESFDFLEKNLSFFSTPEGSEELKKYADFLAQVLLGNYAYNNDEDDWSDPNKRILHTGKLLLHYPNIINLLPDFFSEKLFESFKNNFLGTTATDALLVSLIKPSKQKQLFEIYKKNPHQIAFYAKNRTIAMFMALFPTPSRSGLPEYEHYGVYLPLQNFYTDMDVLAEGKEKTIHNRAQWDEEKNFTPIDEFIVESWETFFDVLSKSITQTEILNAPEWNFNEYTLVLESYLHTLNACNRIQKKAHTGNNSEIQINILKEKILPKYRQFILALGTQLAKQQEKALGLPLKEASLLDVISHQISVSDSIKKEELSLLLSELQNSKIFPMMSEDISTDYSKKALQYLQASLQTLRAQLQDRRLKQETTNNQ